MIGKTLGRYSVEATPVTDRLNHLPVTRAHIRATVIVGLGLFFDLFDVFLAGVLSTVLTASFGLIERVLHRKSTRLNSSHDQHSLAVFCLKKKIVLS